MRALTRTPQQSERDHLCPSWCEFCHTHKCIHPWANNLLTFLTDDLQLSSQHFRTAPFAVMRTAEFLKTFAWVQVIFACQLDSAANITEIEKVSERMHKIYVFKHSTHQLYCTPYAMPFYLFGFPLRRNDSLAVVLDQQVCKEAVLLDSFSSLSTFLSLESLMRLSTELWQIQRRSSEIYKKTVQETGFTYDRTHSFPMWICYFVSGQPQRRQDSYRPKPIPWSKIDEISCAKNDRGASKKALSVKSAQNYLRKCKMLNYKWPVL